jgi:HlyD family secretion protein
MVSIVHAQVMPLASFLRTNGTVLPQSLTLIYAEKPGLVVKEILAEEGQMIRSGQTLARLSSERQLAELAGARGELYRAEQALARAERLKTSGAIAQSEVDAAGASQAEALARVNSLEIDLARTEVRATVAGLLQRRHIEIGEVANENPLFEIATENIMEFVADISDAVWHQVRVGQGADITLANGQSLRGSVRRLSGALDSQTRLGRVWISLNLDQTEEMPAGLVSGAGASVRLQVGSADCLAVPLFSLLFDQHGSHVFVVADDKAVRRSVTLGAQNSEYAEIIAGLDIGDTVVSKAGSLLRDGDPVSVATEINGPRSISQ